MKCLGENELYLEEWGEFREVFIKKEEISCIKD